MNEFKLKAARDLTASGDLTDVGDAVIDTTTGLTYIRSIDDTFATIDTTMDTKALNMESIWEMIQERLGKSTILQTKCTNCGASLEMDSSSHIVKCLYCKSCYIIGTAMVNDRG